MDSNQPPLDPEPAGETPSAELDLHGFRPADVGEIVPEYIRHCREHGLREVRVVHGRGRSQLARSVHAILARLPEVESFSIATAPFGGFGATFVRIKLPDRTCSGESGE